MCKIMDDLREEAIQIGIKQGIEQGLERGDKQGTDRTRIESIRSIMERLKVTAQQAMELLSIPSADRERYLAMLK